MKIHRLGEGFLGARFLLSLFALLLLPGGAFLGCSEMHTRLVPDPGWLQSGNEIKEGFLLCGSQRSNVGVKYLAKEELFDLLRSRAQDPALFDSPDPWVDSVATFLMSATNNSSSTMIVGEQFAVLRGKRGVELESLDFADVYMNVSYERISQEKLKVLAKLLFSSYVFLPGESKEGLLFFSAPRLRAEQVTLEVSFSFADKAMEKVECSFPFVVEAISPDTGEGVSQEKALSNRERIPLP